MIGIIDIGTNTIRLVTYENNKIVSNKALRSEIIRDTNSGYLTDYGKENLCKAIKFLISDIKCEKIYAIATKSLRIIKNKDEVIEKILKETGIKTDILTGDEEAECVYLGVKREIKEDNGLIIDLGGGSCEIIVFENNDITFKKSYDIGTKVLKNKFSNGIYPADEETENINNYLIKKIETQKTNGKIYMTGGTAKTALSLCKMLSKQEKNFITVKETEEISEFIKQNSEEELKKLFSTRYDTISVGITIIRTLADIFKKEEIFVSKAGVREGYMIKRDEIK